MEKNALGEDNKNNYLHAKKDLTQRRIERIKRKKSKHQKQERNKAAEAGIFPDSIHGIPIVDVEFTVPPLSERKRTRNQFRRIRSSFLKHIGENCEKELKAMGLTKTQVETVKKGKSPSGYNVHHKLPIHGGGKNEFSNFILIPIPPHNDLHNKIINPQLKGIQEGETRIIKIPMPKEMVFVLPQNKDKTMTKVANLEDVIGSFKNGKYSRIKNRDWNKAMTRVLAKQKSR